MADVIGINQKRVFTLEQARELLPVVKRVTRAANDRVELLGHKLRQAKDAESRKAVEREVQAVLDEWQRKITGLGCETKGVWLVDFDSGEGYYCWRYPEAELGYFHGYDSGFQGREPIQ